MNVETGKHQELHHTWSTEWRRQQYLEAEIRQQQLLCFHSSCLKAG